MNGNIYVHVGYPKAASTTLQKYLFNKHPEISNFGLYPTQNIGRDTPEIDLSAIFLRDKGLRLFYDEVLYKDFSNYSPRRASILFDKIISGNPELGKATVLSSERFLSVFFSYPDIRHKAERLKAIVPHARIIIMIRNQIDLIRSQYRDWPFDARDFAGGNPVSLKAWIDICFQNDHRIGFMESLQYDRIIDVYATLFGLENVKVLCMEDLAGDLARFSTEISAFMGIDAVVCNEILESKHENRAVSWRMNAYRICKRRLSHIGRVERLLSERSKRKMFRFLERGPSRQYCIRGNLFDKLVSFLGESNRVLEDKYGLPLEKYNYPM